MNLKSKLAEINATIEGNTALKATKDIVTSAVVIATTILVANLIVAGANYAGAKIVEVINEHNSQPEIVTDINTEIV
jgi:hypothetical protein